MSQLIKIYPNPTEEKNEIKSFNAHECVHLNYILLDCSIYPVHLSDKSEKNNY